MIFLDVDQLYFILQQELPADTYIQGSPSAGYSTADQYASASVLADVYTNASAIWTNIFPTTTVALIDQWEQQCFPLPIPALTGISARQARLTAQYTRQPGISYWDIATFCANYFPGTLISVIQFNCGNDSYWTLDESLLDIDTYLGPDYQRTPLVGFSCANGGFWRLGVSLLGYSTRLVETNAFQTLTDAFKFQVNIYATPAASALSLFQIYLNSVQPARCTNTIVTGFVNNFTNVVPNLTKYDSFAALAADPTSETGFTGYY